VEEPKERLIKFGQKAVEAALRAGADEAEAFLSRIVTTTVGIERGQIAKNKHRTEDGLGIRVSHGKTVGFAYTNILNDEAVKGVSSKAVRSAKASKPDAHWKGFPHPKRLGKTTQVFDKKVLELSPEELINHASSMLEEAVNYDKRVFVTDGNVTTAYVCKAVVNSNGVEAFDQGTAVSCSLAALAREASEVTSTCFEYNVQRTYRIDPESVGREVAKLAVEALGARKIKTGTYSVIFTQVPLYQLLQYTLLSALKADNVQRGQSALRGKLDQKIASELVTVHDDGLLEGGLQTWKFDDEGSPTQRTLVVEKGVLKSYLYDHYTAKKEGLESTGNAERGGLAPYTTTPNVEATNFTFKPGNKSADELISETGEGLIVYYLQGAHSSNPVSGEFSVVTTPAWKIEKGEIAYPVKGLMLAGTVFDVLKNVTALGKNVRKFERLVAPWIQVENVKALGKS